MLQALAKMSKVWLEEDTGDLPLQKVKVTATWTRFAERIKLDAVLALVSGTICFFTALNCFRNAHSSKFSLIFIGQEEKNVIGWMSLLMATTGLICICIGGIKITYRNKLSFNKYVAIFVCTLLGNFVAGIVLTEQKKQVHSSLEQTMRERLQESAISRQRFGVGFALSEAWDYLHIQMHCCGVDGYREYFQIKGIPGENALPTSCCVMKSKSELLQPENLSQCRLDAARGVHSSSFLHSQGCLSGLTRWLLRHLSKMTGLLFSSICLQALAILYLSWVGYQRSIHTNNTRLK